MALGTGWGILHFGFIIMHFVMLDNYLIEDFTDIMT